MKSVTIIAVGNIKEKFFSDAVEEYSKRISAYSAISVVEIKEEKLSENQKSHSEIQAALSREGKAVLAAIPKNAFVISLCIEGKKCSSVAFADILDKVFSAGKHVVFIIGSSHGLSDEVKAASDIKLSFSDMTFPHRLMRVILCEQIYRALSILNNGKYHK
jgi:23S rRNA (pseudouridine1915-N3)-methyltransferase